MRVGLFLAASVLAALAALSSASAADGCFPPVGHMRSVQGQVEIKRGAAGWRPATLDEPLCGGDLIRVGDRSRALAAIANLTKRIDQNTTLSLTYVPEDKPAVVGVTEGAVYFFSRKPRVLEVDTPFFDAAIEGTEFLVRVEPHRALLTVFNGRITVRNAEGELTVASGQSLVAEAGQAPAPYVLVRPRDAVQWALFYPIILLPLADRSGMAAREIAGKLGEAVELAARGEFIAAFAAFESIPEPDRGVDFYIYRAATLLSVGRVEDARADIDQALARDPSDGPAYALSAVIAVTQNERDRGLEDAQRAVELSPRSAAARIALSYAEQSRFRIEAARETMQQAVQDEPGNALVWARLSELWLMQGYRERALKAAKKARKLAPELERMETTLGFAALAAIDIGKAKQAFARAIELNSADPQARFGLGLATIRGGDLERGRGDIELAVGLDPNHSLLRSYLGKAYFEQRTTDPAKYLRELFINFPNQENTLAAEQFAIAKQLDPNDPTPWLYDAIRKQSENRPVEALRDIEKSIELNDNRAVYRSRALLDEDRAARGTSLARIYNDLGFEQLGINEATKSLSYDPSSAGAHRFLSDVYATQPGHEIARVSELLQAQLLQDININPVQPSLSVTNRNIITSGGPGRPGFNEFTPLFERNQVQLNATGVAGNENTLVDEAVVTGIYNNISLSAGQFHYQSDGFRTNNDLDYDIYNLFAQAALTPELNVQAEVRRATSEFGDLGLKFDPDLFDPVTTELDQTTARVGVRYSPWPRSNFIGSAIYNSLEKDFRTVGSPTVELRDTAAETTRSMYEGEYIYNGHLFSMQAGFSIFDAHFHRTNRRLENSQVTNEYSFGYAQKHKSGFAYTNINFPNDVMWTLGLSYDDFEDETDVGNMHLQKINPKIGLQWSITPSLSLRLVAFRAVRPPFIANRTIQPTQIAGFNQFFDDFAGTEAWRYGAALDARLTENLTGGVETSGRDLKDTFGSRSHESLYRAYLYWIPYLEWAVSGELRFDIFKSEDTLFPRKVAAWSAPISVRYFHPSGLFAGLSGTPYFQQVRWREFERRCNVGMSGLLCPPSDGESTFFVVDAALGYRFPQRLGLASFEVKNLFNTNFKYQDESFRERPSTWYREAPSVSRFIPERTFFGRLTVNF